MINFLSSLPKIIKRKKKRVGRGLGSGRGAKSGRGTTRHQSAREAVPLHFEGGQGRMVKRFPLLRGKSKNKSIKIKPYVLGLGALNNFRDGDIIDVKALIEKKLVNKAAFKIGVKILANGKLEKKLIFKLPVSKKVKELVEKLGGSV